MISKPEPVFTLLWELLAGQVVRTGYVEDIKFVINFDFPNCSEDYVHRIGRTGRSTNTGTAYTFFTPKNGKQASDLINVLREAKQVISPKLLQLEENSKGMQGGRGRWRGHDSGRGGRGGGSGSRFSSSSGAGRFNNSGGGGSRFSGSSNFSGGFKSQSNFNSGGFRPQNNFNSMGSMNDYGGSVQNNGGQKPYQNGAAGGYKGQWNQGGVTAASLASVQPLTGALPVGKF